MPALDFAFDLDSHDDALEPHRGVEFHEMPVRQILNRCTNPKMYFRWTINPVPRMRVRMCLLLRALYSRLPGTTDPMDFERRIFVKRMAAEVLARTLSRTPIGDGSIAIGTATDPYQPAERMFGLTRGMLEVFAQLSGLHLSITTKSTLVARDIDLIARINQRSKISVNFSCITLNPRLARVLEPRAPRPELRMRTLAMLRESRPPLRRPDDADDPGADRFAALDRKRDCCRARGESEGCMVEAAVSEARRGAALPSVSCARNFPSWRRRSTHSMGARSMRRPTTRIASARSWIGCASSMASHQPTSATRLRRPQRTGPRSSASTWARRIIRKRA